MVSEHPVRLVIDPGRTSEVRALEKLIPGIQLEHNQCTTATRDADFYLRLWPEELRLHRGNDAKGVYLPMPEVARRAKRPGHSLLWRSLGLRGLASCSVLDATGGFGLDSMLMRRWGCNVTVLERSPVMFALLLDGLKRFGQTFPETSAVAVLKQDFLDYALVAGGVDIVYLDPMFPPRNKSARPNKRAQYLAALLGEEADPGYLDRLVETALQLARKRVVVKRRRSDPNTIEFDWQIVGRSVRFDILQASG